MAEEKRPSPDDSFAGASQSSPMGGRIGPYEVERRLGSGGMGDVVLAFDRRLKRKVAIKRIRNDSKTSSLDRQRLRREARAAAGLSHPAVVQIYDILTERDEDSIIMEFVPGQSLGEMLRSGPLPLGTTVHLAQQIIEGLSEAHQSGLVHRDLKAENIMITPQGKAKILDFGLAKQLAPDDLDQSLTREGTLLGTVRAMSPEQASGEKVDSRSDLFSFGTLLYEMLTANSPFKGSNALETLRNVQSREPLALHEIRPDLPSDFRALVDKLLEKDPDKRPQSSREVRDALQGLDSEKLDMAEPPQLRSDSFGNLETASYPVQPVGAAPPKEEGLSSGLKPQPVGESKPRIARLAKWTAIATILALLLALVLVSGAWMWGGSPEQPLRVVVLPPEIQGDSPSADLEFAASGALVAALRTLGELEGVAPIHPQEIGQTSGSLQEAARATAADEILTLSLEQRSGSAWISLQRVRGDDGEVIEVDSFDILLRPSAARLAAETISVRLRRAFPERKLEPGAQQLEVRDEDYEEFIRTSQRIEAGNVTLSSELERVQAIAETSPLFLGARLSGARIALDLYSDTGQSAYLDTAESFLRQAKQLAPAQTIVLQEELRLALARNQTDKAEETLAELDHLAPNSVPALIGRSQIARHQGDLQKAEEAMAQAVERQPTWQSLYSLASLQNRRGNTEGARQTLETLVTRNPFNPWGLGKFAQLELFSGDLNRAEELLARAIDLRPHRSYYVNLGLVRYLLGKYPEAKVSYLEALKLAPNHMTLQLNLADSNLALGLRDEALSGYRAILEKLAEQSSTNTDSSSAGAAKQNVAIPFMPFDPARLQGLEPTDRMTAAQCLVRLGQEQQAIAVTLETLQLYPEDSEVTYQAALVYTLAGELHSALVSATKALEHGIQPRWFQIPGFEALRNSPSFSQLLASRT